MFLSFTCYRFCIVVQDDVQMIRAVKTCFKQARA